MMNKRESLYNIGNDYEQKPSKYFVTTGTSAYSDGLYHQTVKPVYTIEGGDDALNKRIFNVPQSAWAPVPETITSAYADEGRTKVFSDDYATGVVVGDGEVDKEWKKPE